MKYDLELMSPNDFDYEQAYEKGLLEDGVFTEKYNIIVDNYKRILGSILEKKLNLSKYDEQIKKSGLYFKPVKEEDKDMYQNTSLLGLDYIYIRNNFYVERLEKEKLQLLEDLNKSKDAIKEVVKMVLDTYPMVIREDRKEECMVAYGPFTSYFFAPCDSLVLGIRRDKWDRENVPEEKKDDIYFEQEEYFRNIIVDMKNNFKEKFSVPISVFQYNESDVLYYQENSHKKK